MADVTREEVSLATLGSGAAIERFDRELERVKENIADPNTDPKKMRSVKLEVKFFGNEERSYAVMEIHTESKLAPMKPYETGVFIGTDGRRVRAYENDPRQQNLPGTDPGNVTPFKGGQKA